LADSSSSVPATSQLQPHLEKLTARDAGVLLVWILAGLLCGGVAWRYFYQALPEASVHFKVPRAQALVLARTFATAQGAQLANYRSSIIFEVDDNAKTYLERTLGLEKANGLMAGQVSVWYWDVRFFRPQQREEYRVHVSPDGSVVFYDHIVEESRAGSHLDRDTALARATLFLREQLHLPLEDYNFLPEEANPTEYPNRRDWSFAWERKDFRVPAGPPGSGATYRLHVVVRGADVGLADESLKIPEDWLRGYERLRSGNNLVETFALIPYVFLYGAAFWIIFELSKLGLIRWAGPVKLGLFLAALWFINSINTWQELLAEYDTNASYSAFFVSKLLGAGLVSLLQGLLVTLALAPGEPLYRMMQPMRLQLRSFLRLPGLRSKEFFRSCVIGLSLAAVHIGYVVVFYLVAQHFGAWAPQDVNYTDEMSTALPWLSAFVIGLFAATSEEFLFRMFAIPFVHRLTRSKILAVVLPAFAWGFLHANYPQEPAYIRGLEVGCMGMVAGIVMWNWGILATLVWHYTVDATLGSLLLLRSASPYLRVSGAVVAGLAFFPLAFAAVMYVVRGGFEVREDLLNRAQPLKSPEPEPAPAAPERTAVYQAIPRRTLWWLLGCGLAGVALAAAVHPKVIGGFVRYRLDAHQAIAQADTVLRSAHIDPDRYHREATAVAKFQTPAGELATKYLVEKLGVEATNRIYAQVVPQAFWRVRCFRNGEADEYAVIFRADGALHSIWHTLDERAPGPNLTKDQAYELAAAWLEKNKHMDLSGWELIGSESTKRPHRTDTSFTWEQRTALAGGPGRENGAFAEIFLDVKGAEVSDFRMDIKLPEAWERQQTKATLGRTLLSIWPYFFYGLLAVAALVMFFRNFKRAGALVPWRRLARWALVAVAAFAVLQISNLPESLSGYPTDIPYQAFVATQAVILTLGAVVMLGALGLLFGLGYWFLAQAGFEPQLPGWTAMPRNYYRDAVIVALTGGAALLGLGRLEYLATYLWHARDAAIAFPPALDAYPPAGFMIGQAVLHGLWVVAAIGALAGWIACYVRPAWARASLFVGLALTRVGMPSGPLDFTRQLVMALLLIAILWWAISRVIRFNLLGYFLVFALLTLLTAALPWLVQPNSYFRANGVAALTALALLLLWPLVAWQRRTSDGTAPPFVESGGPSASPPGVS
jgi:membrane protease YdiL (CAAX protease family)